MFISPFVGICRTGQPYQSAHPPAHPTGQQTLSSYIIRVNVCTRISCSFVYKKNLCNGIALPFLRSHLLTHSGEILTTGKSHGKKPDICSWFYYFRLWLILTHCSTLFKDSNCTVLQSRGAGFDQATVSDLQHMTLILYNSPISLFYTHCKQLLVL